jgi:hypothetical protein
MMDSPLEDVMNHEDLYKEFCENPHPFCRCVVAGEDLKPGMAVSIGDDGKAYRAGHRSDSILDSELVYEDILDAEIIS